MKATARNPEIPIDPLFVDRWSPRSFDDTKISEQELLRFLEAARWAPSSMNAQPWRFVYTIREDAAWDGFVSGLMPGNAVWASKASALVAVISYGLLDNNGNLVPNGSSAFDTGAAWASIAFQAHLLGWSTHAMGGIDRGKLAEVLDLPADHTIHCVVAVGKMGDPNALPQELISREQPNDRKPLREIVFAGKF